MHKELKQSLSLNVILRLMGHSETSTFDKYCQLAATQINSLEIQKKVLV